jgi:hypothetical protein
MVWFLGKKGLSGHYEAPKPGSNGETEAGLGASSAKNVALALIF